MFSHSVKVHPGGGGRPGRRDEQKARELDLDALEQATYASATDLDALEAAMEMATYSAHVPHDAAPGDELELRNPDGLVVRARLVEFGGSPRAPPASAPQSFFSREPLVRLEEQSVRLSPALDPDPSTSPIRFAGCRR